MWHYCCVHRIDGEWYENTRCRAFLSVLLGLLFVMVVVIPLISAVLIYPLGLLTQLWLNGGTKDFTFNPFANMLAGEIGLVALLSVTVSVGMVIFVFVKCYSGCNWLCGDCRKTYKERYTPIHDA